MAKRNLQEALEQVEMTYAELIPIANNMTEELFKPANMIIARIEGKINTLSNDQIRDYMIELGMKSFTLSEIREKAALKARCSEALKREAHATNFILSDGSQGTKENKAILEVSNEVIAEALYDLVSGLFRSKTDEIHRFVDILKTVLMSRMSDAKLTTNAID